MSSIISPVLTEKSATQIDNGQYVFAVSKSANKITIAKEIKSLYKVEPISVRIVNLPTKNVIFKRVKGVQGIRRKAYVQLPPKTVIPGFETLKENKEAAEKEQAKAQRTAEREAKKEAKNAAKEAK